MTLSKFWPLLFLLVPVGGVGLFFVAPGCGWWLPENVSSFGGKIDHLFYVILGITGTVFVLTELALVYFMFRYADRPGRAAYIHGHHAAEAVWTAVPAAILVFIALYQMNTWKEVKFQSHFPRTEPFAEVTAGQFDWRVRYPGPDGKLGTPDDLHRLNELCVPRGKDIVLLLKSRDFLHSFFLPNLRLKQDAVPGMTIPVWFNATRDGAYPLICAELCGWGHYKMRGKLLVRKPEEHARWLQQAQAEQEQAQ